MLVIIFTQDVQVINKYNIDINFNLLPTVAGGYQIKDSLTRSSVFTLEMLFYIPYDPTLYNNVVILFNIGDPSENNGTDNDIKYGFGLKAIGNQLTIIFNNQITGTTKSITMTTKLVFNTVYCITIKLDRVNPVFSNLYVYLNSNGVAETQSLLNTNYISNDFNSNLSKLETMKLIINDSNIAQNVGYAYIRLWKIPLSENEILNNQYKILFDRNSIFMALNVDFRVGLNLLNNYFYDMANVNPFGIAYRLVSSSTLWPLNNFLVDSFPECVKSTSVQFVGGVKSCNPSTVAVFANNGKYLTFNPPVLALKIVGGSTSSYTQTFTNFSHITIQLWFYIEKTTGATNECVADIIKDTANTFKITVNDTTKAVISTFSSNNQATLSSINSNTGNKITGVWNSYLLSLNNIPISIFSNLNSNIFKSSTVFQDIVKLKLKLENFNNCSICWIR